MSIVWRDVSAYEPKLRLEPVRSTPRTKDIRVLAQAWDVTRRYPAIDLCAGAVSNGTSVSVRIACVGDLW